MSLMLTSTCSSIWWFVIVTNSSHWSPCSGAVHSNHRFALNNSFSWLISILVASQKTVNFHTHLNHSIRIIIAHQLFFMLLFSVSSYLLQFSCPSFFDSTSITHCSSESSSPHLCTSLSVFAGAIHLSSSHHWPLSVIIIITIISAITCVLAL